ncbi:MAG TPA: Ig-like domain-containing protein, partial [Thermoplasmata archaeon]|nr:Ig-like domain-containing protein [Thermoplasmata archaeon]
DANIPDNSQGWGKVRLDDVLYFSGDTRKLWFDDAAFAGGLQTGDRVAYTVNTSAGEPLKITLVWNDFPGHGLINDIDLVVTDPNGTKYLGSVFANGVSTTGGTADNKNANEQVLFASAAAGSWVVEVVGKNVPRGPQPYSLAATGAITGVQKGGSSAPSVVSTTPANKASGVPVTTNVSVVFDRAMDKASVEAAISSNPAVTGAFAWSAVDTTVKLTPSASLTNGTLYQLKVAQSAKDATGKPMTREFAFEFTTATGLKLSVVRTDPSDGQTLVLEDTSVSVLFSQDVVKSSAESGFDLSPVTSGAFSWPLPTSLVFKPTAPLQESTQYTIKVSKDVQDTQGTKLGTDFTATFTTRPLPDSTPPAVAILEPVAGATLAGDVKIKVTATDARGIFEVESFIDGNSLGRLSAAPYEWDWATTSWPNGARELSAVARDTSGNQATTTIQVNVENDVDPPRVVGVSPTDGAKGVGTGAPVTLTFSEPVETAGAQSAFSLSPAAQGTFTWSGNAMKFTPSAPLSAGTIYTTTVKAGVKDLVGNAMAKEFVSMFETGTGGGSVATGGFGALLVPILVIIVIAVAGTGALLAVRKRRKRAPMQTGPMQGVPQTLPCPSCGSATSVGGVSCQSCGANLSAPPPGWGPPS